MHKTSLFQPLGAVLQQAGLVSSQQIELALQEQAKHSHLRIGDILVMRGWLKPETANFFAEQWSWILQQPCKQPLGQYLKAAGLLDEDQINAILEEQKRTGLRFGVLAVLQEWVEQPTIDFFLQHLAPDHQLDLMPKGMTIEDRDAFNHSEDLKRIRDRLLHPHSCEPDRLLMLYQQLLHQPDVVANGTLEEFELLELGLVVKEQDKLRIANPIYRSVFDRSWVEQELGQLRPADKILLKQLELDTKAVCPYRLLAEIQLWTGSQSFLIHQLVQLLRDSESLIPAGEEAVWIEQIVQTRLIDNWENQVASKHLQTIRDRLLNNTQCAPFRLLMLYLHILQRGKIVANNSQEQLELLNSGLVVQQQDKLIVANRIYQYVFSWDWANKELLKSTRLSFSKTTLDSQEESILADKNFDREEPSDTPKFQKTKRPLFLLTVFALLASSIILFFKSREEQVFQQGNELFSKGKYKEALAKYNEVLNINGNYYQAWTNRGYALAGLKEYNQMLASCSAATIIKPQSIYAWNCQGEALHNLKQYQEAIAAFDKAIAIDPNDPIFWINKSISLLALQQSEAALAVIERAIALLEQNQQVTGQDQISRELTVALSKKGKVLSQMQRYAEALAVYEELLKFAPHYFPAQRNRGIVLKKLRRYEEASTQFNDILNRNAELTDAQKAETWFYQGLTLCESGQVKSAIAALNQALQLKPDYQAAKTAKRNCHKQSSQTD
jgi:tetratricopeptide (TPR) repeat protein